jgi:hypothetical protein
MVWDLLANLRAPTTTCIVLVILLPKGKKKDVNPERANDASLTGFPERPEMGAYDMGAEHKFHTRLSHHVRFLENKGGSRSVDFISMECHGRTT